MAKKLNGRSLPSLSDCLHFSIESTAKLYSLASRSKDGPPDIGALEQFRNELNKAALRFAFQRIKVAPITAVQAKAFAGIEKAAERLLKLLDAPTGNLEEVPTWIQAFGGLEDFNRRRALRRVGSSKELVPLETIVDGVWQLKISANFARMQKQNLKQKQHGRTSDEATNTFLSTLMDLWREEFRRHDVPSKAFNGFATVALGIIDPRVKAEGSEKSTRDGAVRRRVERSLGRAKSK